MRCARACRTRLRSCSRCADRSSSPSAMRRRGSLVQLGRRSIGDRGCHRSAGNDWHGRWISKHSRELQLTDLPDPATAGADASPSASAEPPPRSGPPQAPGAPHDSPGPAARRNTHNTAEPALRGRLHRGRRSGRAHATPVAARRVADGFVIAFAFGARVDWYRNLRAAGGGWIRWRGRDYPVGALETIEQAVALPAFLPVQRVLFRLARVAGFIRLRDERPRRGCRASVGAARKSWQPGADPSVSLRRGNS